MPKNQIMRKLRNGGIEVNITTKKFPRTLNEAFGPYADTRYCAPKKESPLWWPLGVVLLAVLVLLVFSQA